MASEHKDRATSYIRPRAFASEVMRLSGGTPDNTLYDNETSGTGSGGFHIPSNMAEDIREARFTELTEPSVK